MQAWRSRTAPLSLLSQISKDPAYLEIISLGPAVIPLIVEELDAHPSDPSWFSALREITQANPAADAASFREASAEWIRWASENNTEGAAGPT